MNFNEEESTLIEEDYYARLNVSREATQEDITAAYRRLSRLYHPDKHPDTEQKKKADLLFSHLKKAYEVLSDPHQRAIYDTVGVKGLNTDGWEIVQRTRNPQEIREEYERLAREKKERRLQQRTNPKGHLTVNINATDIFFTQYDDDELLDYADSSFFPTIEVSGMSISQSVEAPLTLRDTLTLSGSLATQNGNGTGSFIVSCKRLLTTNGWIEGEFAAGNGPIATVKLFRTLTQTVYGIFSAQFKLTSSGIRLGFVSTLGMPLDRHTQGYLTWSVGLASGMTSMIVRDTDKSHSGVVFSLGLSSSFISMNHTWKMNEDLKLRAYCKIGTLHSVVECSAEKKVSEQSSLSAAVSIGVPLGVVLKIKIVRAHLSYSFPIHLCEEPRFIPSVYAAVTPIFVWFVVKKLVVDPFKKEEREKNLERTKEVNKNKMEEKKREAEAAVDLMQALYERVRTEEESKNGLVILKAVYGKEADTAAESSNLTSSQRAEIIDVTVPLQCLVKNSSLVLHDNSKSQLSGFYDPCVGEDKVLFVQYLFHSHLCQTTIKDQEALRIPKQSHRLNIT